MLLLALSLRPASCAPRVLCAPRLVRPWLLMASLTLSLLTGGFLAAPNAHAGSYTWSGTDPNTSKPIQSPTYSSGTSTATQTTPGGQTTNANDGPVSGNSPQAWGGSSGFAYGYSSPTVFSGKASCTGTITAAFTWQPAAGQTAQTDPPPTSVIVEETCDTGWNSSQTSPSPGCSPTGQYSNPFGGTVTSSTYSGDQSGVRYSGAGGASFSTSAAPTASASAGGSTGSGFFSAAAHVGYGATVYYLGISLGGTLTDGNGKPILDSSGNQQILVGQKCTATVNGIPSDLVPYATYKWAVSGTTFESWGVVSDPSNQSHTVEVDATPATNPTQWYWNDLGPKPTAETVSCTVTVTPPASLGSTFSFTVSAPQSVTVYVPQLQAVAIGGYMQVNKALPNDPTHNNLWAGPTAYEKSTGALPGGMNWQATVTTPNISAFGPGNLELVQLVTPSNSYTTVANPTVTKTDPENQNANSLDLNYPYGGDISPESPGSPNPTYRDNDAPSLQLDGSNILATANKSGSYTDYLMYEPPGSRQFIVLATFGWSASGSATIPGNKNWSSYTSTSVAGVSDGAGTVTPPGKSPPQTTLPTPASFTLVTAPNTFPKWTHIDLGGAF